MLGYIYTYIQVLFDLGLVAELFSARITACVRTDILTFFLFPSLSQVQKQVPLCVCQPLQVQPALGQVEHPDRPQRAKALQRRRKGGVRNECADSGSLGALRTRTASLKDFMRWFVSFNDNKTQWKLFLALWRFSKLGFFQWCFEKKLN